MARVSVLSRLASRVRALATDVVDAAVLLREVEEARWIEGPAPLVARLRARGRRSRLRSPLERRMLLSVVYRLDVWMNGESNCYRRSLVHLAVDRESALAPLSLGLDVARGEPRGHAWVAGPEVSAEKFDVEFTL